MTTPSLARISRISFHTDMTRVGAAVIPLAVMLEAVVPGRARWLGLLGRAEITKCEVDLINFATWPKLKEPVGLITELFESAWNAGPGNAGDALSRTFGYSALRILSEDAGAVAQVLKATTAADWALTRHSLLQNLEAFERELEPTITAPVLPFQAPKTIPAAIPQLDRRERQRDLKAAA